MRFCLAAARLQPAEALLHGGAGTGKVEAGEIPALLAKGAAAAEGQAAFFHEKRFSSSGSSPRPEQSTQAK